MSDNINIEKGQDNETVMSWIHKDEGVYIVSIDQEGDFMISYADRDNEEWDFRTFINKEELNLTTKPK